MIRRFLTNTHTHTYDVTLHLNQTNYYGTTTKYNHVSELKYIMYTM